jgi:predicted nucleic-acid-binding Zn-ribbon protein
MHDLLHCPKCGSDQLTGFGARQTIAVTDINFTKEDEDEVLADLFGSDNRDRQCLQCGYRWNAEERLIQLQEDQNQINALTFKERTNKFYATYESGQIDQARQIVPVEAIGVYKRKGLRAAYRFLKLVDVKINRFKKRVVFAVVIVLLIFLGVYMYACN